MALWCTCAAFKCPGWHLNAALPGTRDSSVYVFCAIKARNIGFSHVNQFCFGVFSFLRPPALPKTIQAVPKTQMRVFSQRSGGRLQKTKMLVCTGFIL